MFIYSVIITSVIAFSIQAKGVFSRQIRFLNQITCSATFMVLRWICPDGRNRDLFRLRRHIVWRSPGLHTWRSISTTDRIRTPARTCAISKILLNAWNDLPSPDQWSNKISGKKLWRHFGRVSGGIWRSEQQGTWVDFGRGCERLIDKCCLEGKLCLKQHSLTIGYDIMNVKHRTRQYLVWWIIFFGWEGFIYVGNNHHPHHHVLFNKPDLWGQRRS